jgi:uncharacterized membrane protein YoaK (UPF0700 family)
MSNTLRDAWHTLAPPDGDPHGPLAPLLLGLTVVTGLVDAFSYLVLGHVFVANMTGNVVFLAFGLIGAPGFSIGASLVALAAFAVGALACGRVLSRLDGRRGRMLAASTAFEVVLVAGSLITGWVSSTPGVGEARYVLIVLLGLATGMQNGTARRLAVPDLTTTVLTMTVTGAAFDSRLAGGTGSRIGRRGLSAGAMFVGALVGAALVLHAHPTVALAIALVLLAAVTVLAARLARTRPVWDRPT